MSNKYNFLRVKKKYLNIIKNKKQMAENEGYDQNQETFEQLVDNIN